MKRDFNKLMKNQIEQLNNKPKLLLHVCCAPCSSAVIEKLKNYFDITLFYFNPNTYPIQEYNLRAKQFSKLTNLPLIVWDYNHEEFLKAIKGLENMAEGSTRCQKCIALRMQYSYEYALFNHYDYFTTTLSISPHKDADFINSFGESLPQFIQTKENCLYLSTLYPTFNLEQMLTEFPKPKYLHADFKKENGYLDSIKLSKQFDLYRQDYCGCEFSMSHLNKKDNL